MRNSKLSLAMIATMERPAVAAAIASGSLTKSDIRTILALQSSGGAYENIAKHIGDAVIRTRKLRKIGTVIGKYASQRVMEVQRKEKPMTTFPDIVARRVEKAAETQRALRDSIREYQAAHPGCNRQDAIDKILFSRPVSALHQRGLEEVAKLGGSTLPQPRTADIDFGSPGLRGTAGYDSSVDGRRPGRAHADGGPQSGAEDQPTIEDHNEVLARLVKAGIAAGKSHSKAVTDAADDPAFKVAFAAYKAWKYGV